jgi:selenocysteine lyase/cysteine desulfurase
MLSCKQSKFTMNPSFTYLNCAYMSPLLKSVEKAGLKGVRRKRNPFFVQPESFFDENLLVRQEFAKTINTADWTRVALLPSVSYGMATVAKNITVASGDNIIVASGQFPSNYYVWKKKCDEAHATLRTVEPPDTLKERGRHWNERILESIDKKTRLVALGHVHWADGTKFLLEQIRVRTREVGALLIIDGTQSIGALGFDLSSIQADAVIAAGYKWLLGPYSIAMGYFGPHFDDGSPLEENWISRKNSEDFAALVNYQDEYKPGAFRYDVGEHSNFILMPMMLKALEQINRWNPSNIQEYCADITKASVDILRENGFWIEDEAYRAAHLFGVRLPVGKDLTSIKEKLKRNKILVSFRGDAIRVSPNVYNKEADVLRLSKTLVTP